MEFEKHFELFMNKVRMSFTGNDVEFEEFKKLLYEKMVRGYQEHGDGVFDWNTEKLLSETLLEAMDLTGWPLIVSVAAKRENQPPVVLDEIISLAISGFKTWCRIKELQKKIARK